jgi:hypothetical protein
MQNNIILSDGNGQIRARYSGSWTMSGIVNTTASVAVSSSFAETASYYGGSVVSASYALSSSYAISSSNALTASSVGILNQNVLISGSLSLTGSGITINGDINSTNTVNNIIGRTMIYGGDNITTGATPRLIISGSDGGFSEFGRGFNFINTVKVLGSADASGQIYANSGSTAGQYIGVYDDPNFNTDVEHAILVNSSGVTLNDWDNGSAFDYVPYMTIAPNLGDNPTPQMKRGLGVTGSLTIQSGSGDLFVYGHKQFNVGAFSSNISQSGSANVSQSMNFETTDISNGVSIASNSRITLANAGTYNIQFSAQILADTGADDVYIWLKKNGTNVTASAGHIVLANNEELIASWNYVVEAAASDYFELAWQSTTGDSILLNEAATGNIPSIPSVILTVTQVR